MFDVVVAVGGGMTAYPLEFATEEFKIDGHPAGLRSIKANHLP
jgi:hypothetical protein